MGWGAAIQSQIADILRDGLDKVRGDADLLMPTPTPSCQGSWEERPMAFSAVLCCVFTLGPFLLCQGSQVK